MRLRPYGESGPLAVPYSRARAVPDHAGPRVGALRVAQGARADRRAARRARRAGHAVRLSQVPRLRRLRRPARHPPPDPRAGQAPRLRAEHQARAGRHPRDRVHRAGAAARPRRARARAARARHAAGARRARRARPAARARPSPRCATPTSSCATSSTGCSIATTGRRRRCPRTPRSATRSRTRWVARTATPSTRRSPRIGRRSRRSSRDSSAPSGPRPGATRTRDPRPTARPALPALAALWADDVAADTRAQTLAAAGFADPDGLLANLTRVRASARYVQLPALSRQRVDALVPQLLAAAAATPDGGADAQAVFQRLFELLEAVSRRSAYLALLTEHPPMLPRLAQLMGASQWAADYLTRHPILLDELLDARVLLAEPDWDAWRDELARLLAGQRGRRRAADGRAAPLPARAVVPAARAGPRRTADRRAPRRPPVRAGRRRPRGDARRGAGRRWQGAGRAAAAVRDHRLRQARRQGAGLRVRPRPRLPLRRRRRRRRRSATAPRAAPHHLAHQHDGRRASSTTPTCGCAPTAPRACWRRRSPAFRRYQREQAWTWEHQALTRARFVAGDAAIGAAFEAERDAILRLPRDRGDARADVVDMRRRMLAGHPEPDAAVRPQARRRAAWSTSSSRSSTWSSRTRTTTRC